MTSAPDPLWPAASTLLAPTPWPGRRNVGLVGVSTYLDVGDPALLAVDPRGGSRGARALLDVVPSAGGRPGRARRAGRLRRRLRPRRRERDPARHRPPRAARPGARPDHRARRRQRRDLARAASRCPGATPRGGASSPSTPTSTCATGPSNGSPVRQLLEAGLTASTWCRSASPTSPTPPAYARVAADAGDRRRELARRGAPRAVEEAAADAIERAGAGGRPVYVDVDMDAADRAVVPGCPAALPGGLSADEMRRFVRACLRRRARRRDRRHRDRRGARQRRPAHRAARRRCACSRPWPGCGGAAVTVVVGRGALSRAELVAVARRRERVELERRGAGAPGRVSARRSTRWSPAGQPVYGLSTGFGSLATTFISPERAPRPAALAHPLPRRGRRRRRRDRGRARDDGLAPHDPVQRRLRGAPATARRLRGAAQRAASPRSCTSSGRSAARATSRRWRTWRSP